MKPGHIGAILVVTGGVVLAGAVFAKDRAQLGAARSLYADGERALAGGKAKDARESFRRALASALVVGGITGRRPAALEIASDSRRALRVCEAVLAAEKGDSSGLDVIDEAATRPELKDSMGKLAQKELAREQGLLAESLERLAVETDKRPGDPGRTKAELHTLAEKAWTLALEAEKKLGPEPDGRFSKGARRSHARALVQGALAANLADQGAEARKLAEQATTALSNAADAFDLPPGDASPAGGDKEISALRELVRGITAEGRDRERVNAFEAAVANLDAHVDTKSLGELLPAVQELKEPELEGRHKGAEELAKKLAAAKDKLARIREAAEQFAGMVLAVDGPVTKVYIDRYEVTNAEFKKFVDEKKPYGEGRTPEVWGSAEAAKSAADFYDAGETLQGPKGWREGRFPEGQEWHPVAGVCALEARAFARARGKRLPTYDEWLAAAGVAQGSPVPAYPWGNAWREGGGNVARPGASATGTMPVGKFAEGRAPSGADDLIGNVCELVEQGSNVVAVGGSYQSKPDNAMLKFALPRELETRPVDQGFRCARELTWKR